MKGRSKEATTVTIVGVVVNLFLSGLKLLAGIVGHSSALIADAVHSLSDLATDVAVIIGVRLADEPPDQCHRYGHGKYETIATVLVGLALLAVGAGIFASAALKIHRTLNGTPLESPTLFAFGIALLSIVSKEWLYRYTYRVGRRLRSRALIANAWHHRSDALSSIGVALGVGGAVALGGRWSLLDPIAALIVSILVLRVALQIIRQAIGELLEKSLPHEVEQEIIETITSFPNVTHPHNLRTRQIGNDIAIDLHIRLPGDFTVDRAHDITRDIERQLRHRFGASTFISLHVEPSK